jgi:hypothetical protein
MVPFASECARVLAVFMLVLSAHGWETEYTYTNTVASAASAALWTLVCHMLSHAQEKLYWRACPTGAHVTHFLLMGLFTVAGCFTGSPAAYVPYLYLFAVDDALASTVARTLYLFATLFAVLVARVFPRGETAHTSIQIAVSVILFFAWFDSDARTKLHTTMATSPVRDASAGITSFLVLVLCTAMMGESLLGSSIEMGAALAVGTFVAALVPILSASRVRLVELCTSIALGVLCFFLGSAGKIEALYGVVLVVSPSLLALALHRISAPAATTTTTTTTVPSPTQEKPRKARHMAADAIAMALCGALVATAPVYAHVSRAGPELQTALVMALA